MKYIAPVTLLLTTVFLMFVGIYIIDNHPSPIVEAVFTTLWLIFWGSLLCLFAYCIDWITDIMVDGSKK